MSLEMSLAEFDGVTGGMGLVDGAEGTRYLYCAGLEIFGILLEHAR